MEARKVHEKTDRTWITGLKPPEPHDNGDSVPLKCAQPLRIYILVPVKSLVYPICICTILNIDLLILFVVM